MKANFAFPSQVFSLQILSLFNLLSLKTESRMILLNDVLLNCSFRDTTVNKQVRDRSFFMREGGLVGFGKHHLKIA